MALNSKLRRLRSPRVFESLEDRTLLAADGLSEVSWVYRGSGGGGALFSPSISPHNAENAFIASDMGQVFRTRDAASWDTIDFRQLQGNVQSQVQFTNDPDVVYAVNAVDGFDISRPAKSSDGGVTWNDIADPTSNNTYALFADHQNATRLLVSDFNTLYYSNDGGQTFEPKYVARDANCNDETVDGCGLHVGGALFAGENIYVGTGDGLLESTDGGQTFKLADYAGLPSGAGILSLSGGVSDNGETKLFVVVRDTNDIWPGVSPAADYWYEGCDGGRIFVLTLSDSSQWEAALPCDEAKNAAGQMLFPFFVDMARNQTETIYLAGGSEGGVPIVYKSVNGGDSWESVLHTENNQNIQTGRSGNGGLEWYWAETLLGLDVASNDSDEVLITDFGFAHRSSDGGGTWQASYVQHEDLNASGQPSANKPYRGSGVDNTTSWGVLFATPDNLITFNSDIGTQISRDGGQSFGFEYEGLDRNSVYRAIKDPSSEMIYAAVADVHDIYQSTYLTDARLDSDTTTGAILRSSDQGRTWTELKSFPGAVVWIELDPQTPNRLFASVLHTENGEPQGGIWVSNNIETGAAATWQQLATPPRTEGHPYNIRVLDDGSIVASYSARRANVDDVEQFTQSAGVFYSDDGGESWEDRSHPDMTYWTKDVVINPHDPSQDTWYVGVWSGWGNDSRDLGGLFRTHDRGQTWTKILEDHRVSSITVNPEDPNVAHATTERSGLWYTTELRDPLPHFSLDQNYAFRQPERVVYNPFDASEIWVSSFGGGLRVGKLGEDTTSKITADIDQSGSVDFADFLILSQNFGKSGDLPGDLNDDDLVNFADFLILSAEFGRKSNS